jgi:hypothetical protein
MGESIVALVQEFFRNDTSRSKWKWFLALSVGTGLLIVCLHAVEALREASSGIILSGASLFTGILLGFLFGIPKSDKSAFDQRQSSASRHNLSYELNTNLEDISDWLTKIIVGVGLVQLKQLPTYIRRLADFWASSFNGGFPIAYVAGLIIFFAANGFLIGYLWTRLSLIGDFIEQDPQRILGKVLDNVAHAAEQDTNITNRPTEQPIAPQELKAAQAVASVASSSSITIDDLRGQILTLAQQYESIRSTIGSGPERSKEMAVIVSQLRAFSYAAYSLLPQFIQSDSAGEKLTAIVFLQTKPDLTRITWLEQQFPASDAFVQYQIAVALQSAARDASSDEMKEEVRKACMVAKGELESIPDSSRTVRYQIINSALAMTLPASGER